MITRRSLLRVAPAGLLLPKPALAFTLADRLMAIAPATGGGVTSTWNGSDKSANITLSGSNLIATVSDANNAFVRSTPTTHSTGKWAVIFSAGSTYGVYAGAGIANSSYTVSQNVPGYDSGANSCAITDATLGNSHFGIAGSSVGGGVGAGSRAGGQFNLAIDMDVTPPKGWLRFWDSLNTWSADWNNISSCVPGDANGVAFTGLNAGPYMLIWGDTAQSGDSVTLNPNPTAWSDGTSLQAGFSAFG